MDYEQSKINSLLSEIEWLREDLLYLKDIVRSGNSSRTEGKVRDFLQAFNQRIQRKL